MWQNRQITKQNYGFTSIYFKFQSIPEDGIQILNGVLHSHLAGRKMRLRHIRNGKELPVILQGEP